MRALVLLLGCACAMCGHVDIEGEISFDLREGATHRPRSRLDAIDNVTRPAPVECVYQYPEAPQVEAMLSTMMNQLTKMYVRVNKFMTEQPRRHDKRFNVVQNKSTAFFDHIYSNMTETYRGFVNHTQSRVLRASDPCEHQTEIREMWRTLINSSQEAVRRAALQCVEQHVLSRAAGSARARARARASRLLRRELARLRTDHLALLCDTFQLCYNELL